MWGRRISDSGCCCSVTHQLVFLGFFPSLQKVEGRVSSDEDLKLSELLRYYMLNIEAAKVRIVYFLKLSFAMSSINHSLYSLCFKKTGKWTLMLPKKPETLKPQWNIEAIY